MTSILLEGKAKEIALEIQAFTIKANDEGRALAERLHAESDAFNESRKQTHKELWAKLTAETGIDPDANHTVDNSYVEEHGHVYLQTNVPGDDDDQAGESKIGEFLEMMKAARH